MLTDKNFTLNFNQIQNFNFPMDELFTLKINLNNVTYDFIIRLSSNNNKLLCFGTGAQARDKKSKDGKIINPPYFDRWSWYNHFEESFIVYSDPTFYYDDKITLGWYVGGEEWYLEKISLIIKEITKNIKISNKNIFFYGSSGGGFASICLATLIKNSKCLVNNPQFSIFSFYYEHVKNLFNFLQNQFPNLSNEYSTVIENDTFFKNNDIFKALDSSDRNILKKIYYRLDCIYLFEKEQYVPEITIYINLRSEIDLNNNCIPFLNRLSNLNFFKN